MVGGSRGGALAVLLVAVGLLAGCRVDTRVAIAVRPEGAGTVTVTVVLDEAAAARVPELADQLEVDDLLATGWEVDGPRDVDGGLEVVARKGFASPEAAPLVLAELTGPGGPLRDLAVERRPGPLHDRWRFTGTADLTAGLAGFSDDALRERLDGTDVGATVEELEAAAGRPLAEAATFEVAVSLPGRMSVDGREMGGTARWQPVLGESVELVATSERVPPPTVAWFGVAAGAGLALLAVAARRLVARRRRRRTPSTA